VAARIVSAIGAIHERHEGEAQILLVGHGAAMAVALGALLDENPAEWTNYPLANCSLTELVLSPAPYVNFLNSTYHL
jgi:broad specificity phosphatase PhoE